MLQGFLTGWARISTALRERRVRDDATAREEAMLARARELDAEEVGLRADARRRERDERAARGAPAPEGDPAHPDRSGPEGI